MGDAKRRDVFVERHLIIMMVMGSTDQGQETIFSMTDVVRWGIAGLCRSYVIIFGGIVLVRHARSKFSPQDVI